MRQKLMAALNWGIIGESSRLYLKVPMATLGTFTFPVVWNDFTWPYLVLNSNWNYPLVFR